MFPVPERQRREAARPQNLELPFSKNHLTYRRKNEKVGGPKDLGSLFSIEEIKADFDNYHFRELAEVEIELNEGVFHNGVGSVVRFVAEKK